MSFHHDFWVGIVTAGPVLGLSHLVAVERSLAFAFSAGDRDPRVNVGHWVRTGHLHRTKVAKFRLSGPQKVRATAASVAILLPYLIAAAGFGASGDATLAAFKCLARESDAYTLSSVQLDVKISFATLVLGVFALYFMPRRLEIARRPRPD